MAQQVKVFRWDDVDAPQVTNGLYSEFINVIDKCLTTGYSEKQSLGWTKEINTSTASSYKNKGSGSVVIFSAFSGANDDKGVFIQSAQSAVTADNLFNAGAKQVFRVFKNHNDKWILIGTNKGFYCFFNTLGSYNLSISRYTASFFAGDLSLAVTNDTGRFITVCNPFYMDTSKELNSTDSGWGANIEHLNVIPDYDLKGGGFKIYDMDGHTSSATYLIHRINLPVSSDEIGAQPINNVFNNLTLVLKDFNTAKDRDNKKVFESTTRPVYRGCLPGVFSTLIPHTKDMQWPGFISYEQSYYLFHATARNTASKIVLATESWDD
jgi:hypothetical protein